MVKRQRSCFLFKDTACPCLSSHLRPSFDISLHPQLLPPGTFCTYSVPCLLGIEINFDCSYYTCSHFFLDRSPKIKLGVLGRFHQSALGKSSNVLWSCIAWPGVFAGAFISVALMYLFIFPLENAIEHTRSLMSYFTCTPSAPQCIVHRIQ